MIAQFIKNHLNQVIELEVEKETRKTGKISKKKLTEIQEKFASASWIQEVANASKQVQEVGISLATHTAKGIHSSSKSSNLIIQKNHNNSNNYIGSDSIPALMIDANNSNPAVYIKSLTMIVDFLNIWADNQRFYQLIIQNHAEIQTFFEQYFDLQDFEFFKELLSSNIQNPKISERDKQILFPIGDEHYHTLFPVYPSALAHQLFNQINEIKYSDKKTAKDNKQPYVNIVDLASVKLGGTKPLNVSVLNSKQNGRNYLLPSIPPQFSPNSVMNIPKSCKNIFDLKSLEFFARNQLKSLFNIIKIQKNNVYIRDKRKAILDEIVFYVFEMAWNIQNTRPAGWSKEYRYLSMAQKYWLDPHRAELPDEDEFRHDREHENWRQEIEIAFADWLQKLLKNEFRPIAHEFAEPEHNEWRDEIKTEIQNSLRLGQGIF